MYRFVLTTKLMLAVVFFASGPVSAQLADPRTQQLQEQIRLLTGQIEELNFQMLQMQESMRKQQEDMEFRLQDMEDRLNGGSQDTETDNGDASKIINEVKQTDVATNATTTATAPRLNQNESAVIVPSDRGAPPRNLGSITLGSGSEVLGTSIDFSAQGVETSIDGTQVASVGGVKNPEELYEAGYGYILSGDYSIAEDIFSTFIDTYPNDQLAADAYFWYGESLLAQGKFEDAADIFIETRSLFPDARKTPETMLKIGTIMAALGNREVACVTFEDALKNQTEMSAALRGRIGQERVKAKC